MPLVSQRAALLLLIAFVAGIVAGVLGFFGPADRNVAGASLIGAGAAGGTLALFSTLI